MTRRRTKEDFTRPLRVENDNEPARVYAHRERQRERERLVRKSRLYGKWVDVSIPTTFLVDRSRLKSTYITLA